MFSTHFFSPDLALLLFVFLLLFFVNLSFRLKWLLRLMAGIYFWRLGMEILNRLENFYLQNYFWVSTDNSFFQEYASYLKVGAAVLLFAFFYWFSARVFNLTLLKASWFLSLLLSLALAGFFISSLLVVFAAEWGSTFSGFMQEYFIYPSAQLFWFALPFLLALLTIFPLARLRKKIQLKV